MVLQHGSVLCGPAHHGLIDLLSLREDEAIALLKRELRERTTDLASILGAPVSLQALAACIREGFEKEWGISFFDEEIRLNESTITISGVATHHD